MHANNKQVNSHANLCNTCTLSNSKSTSKCKMLGKSIYIEDILGLEICTFVKLKNKWQMFVKNIIHKIIVLPYNSYISPQTFNVTTHFIMKYLTKFSDTIKITKCNFFTDILPEHRCTHTLHTCSYKD